MGQPLVSADHEYWSAVTECLAALSALEKNQDKVENHVVECVAGAHAPKNYKDAITYAEA